MIKTLTNEHGTYPAFQATHNAARFCLPFALEVCTGKGYDIGTGKVEWCLPGAQAIDPKIDPKYDAMHLPDDQVDYIFSSHCLEHLNDWVRVLDYWASKLKAGGVLFLYLPHYSQRYWRPWNNVKHVNILEPHHVGNYMAESGLFTNVWQSGIDLNHSFIVMGERKH